MPGEILGLMVRVKKVVEKSNKLIIDLRGNIGGLVTETKQLGRSWFIHSKDEKSNYIKLNHHL